MLRKYKPNLLEDTQRAFYVKKLLDFPEDKFVTTFKFHTFMSNFGPWPSLVRNIQAIITYTGFAGIINRNLAGRLLLNQPYTALIRYSRNNPTSLVYF